MYTQIIFILNRKIYLIEIFKKLHIFKLWELCYPRDTFSHDTYCNKDINYGYRALHGQSHHTAFVLLSFFSKWWWVLVLFFTQFALKKSELFLIKAEYKCLLFHWLKQLLNISHILWFSSYTNLLIEGAVIKYQPYSVVFQLYW